jgi:hypothetical protein
MDTALLVVFAEHVSLPRVAGMLSGIEAYGSVAESAPRTFEVRVHRRSQLSSLREQLVSWERYGFLRWSVVR